MSLPDHEKFLDIGDSFRSDPPSTAALITMDEEKRIEGLESGENPHPAPDAAGTLQTTRTKSDIEEKGSIRRPVSYHSGHETFFKDEADAKETPSGGSGSGSAGGEAHPKEFEVHWDGDDDPMNPRNMKTWRKWIVVLTVCMSSVCV